MSKPMQWWQVLSKKIFPTASLQTAPGGGGGAVLAIRDHPTPDLVGYPDPWWTFQGGNSAWWPHPHAHRAPPHSRLSPPPHCQWSSWNPEWCQRGQALMWPLPTQVPCDVTMVMKGAVTITAELSHSFSFWWCSEGSATGFSKLPFGSTVPALGCFPFAWHFCPLSRADATEQFAWCKAVCSAYFTNKG